MRQRSNPTFIALLRGINVGGKNMLPMKELVKIFVDAGYSDVKTYIQSGNVVFKASGKSAAPDALAKRIEQRVGFAVPVIVRTAEELARVTRDNPFLRSGADETALHVMFLAVAPTKSAISTLDDKRSPTDEFRVVGREIYLHCPHGLGRTKLTNAYFDGKLATTSTVRNWRTVLKLIDMAKG